MPKQIIALSGKKSSGKDTSAEYIASRVRGVEYFALATPVKEFARSVLGLDWCQVYGTEAQKNTMTPYRWEDMPISAWGGVILELKTGPMTARQVVQYWATEILRSIDEDIFIKRCHEVVSRSRCDVAVITDMRFANEAEFALANGWKILRFTRSVDRDTHRSETELDRDKFDWNLFSGVIDNANLSVDEKNTLIRDYLIEWGLL